MTQMTQLDRRTVCNLEPEERELYRYLGYGRKDEPDAKVREAVSRCVRDLQKECRPQFVSMRTALFHSDRSAGENREEPEALLEFAGITVRSRDLFRNLRGCTEIVLFAATLGVGPDRLIARAGISHVSDMVIYQAAAAAMTEAWCNEKNREIRTLAGAEGLSCRPRFSPGYGDFSLEHQRDILRVLDASRQVGITLTKSLLMAPSKSVTAVIGLATAGAACDSPASEYGRCAACGKTDCLFRDV